jgi:hypothetical protein
MPAWYGWVCVILVWCALCCNFFSSVAPLVDSYLDMNSGLLQLYFDAAVVPSTVDIAKLALFDSEAEDAPAFLLTAPDANVLPISSGRFVLILLTERALQELRLQPRLAQQAETTFLVALEGIATTVTGFPSTGTLDARVRLTQLIRDNGAPELLSAELHELGGGGLALRVLASEPLLTNPVLSFQSAAGGLTLPAIPASPNLTQSLAPTGALVEVSITLLNADPVRSLVRQLLAITTPSLPRPLQLLVSAGTLADRAGNAAPRAQTLPVTVASLDLVAPQLVAAELVFVGGQLDMLVSEPILPTSVRPEALHLQLGNGTDVALGAFVLSIEVSGARLLLQLAPTLVESLELQLLLQGGSLRLSWSEQLLDDTNGNPILPGSNLSLSVVADSSPARVLAGSLNPEAGLLRLLVSRPLLPASVRLQDGLTLRLIAAPIVSLPLQLQSAGLDPGDVQALLLQLQPASRLALQAAFLHAPAATAQLLISGTLATDAFGNPVQDDLLVLQLEPDTTPPTAESAAFEQPGPGSVTLALRFSEAVRPTAADLLLVLLPQGAAAIQVLATVLTTELNVVHVNVSARFSELGQLDVSALAAMQLNIPLASVVDAFGNTNAAVAGLAVDTSSLDFVPPVPLRALLNLDRGEVTITFSEAVALAGARGAALLRFHFGPSGLAVNVSITAATQVQVTQNNFTWGLASDALEELTMALADAALRSNLTLAVPAHLVVDLRQNPSRSALAVPVVELVLDQRGPRLATVRYDRERAELQLSFSEPLLAAPQFSRVALQNQGDSLRQPVGGINRRAAAAAAAAGVAVFYPLQDAVIQATANQSTWLVVLGPDDRAIVGSLPNLATRPENTFVVVEGDFTDAFGNRFLGRNRSAALPATEVAGAIAEADADAKDSYTDFYRWYWIASTLLRMLAPPARVRLVRQLTCGPFSVFALGGVLLLTWILLLVYCCRRRMCVILPGWERGFSHCVASIPCVDVVPCHATLSCPVFTCAHCGFLV